MGIYRDAIQKYGSFRKAAAALGIKSSTLQHRVAAEETTQPPKPGNIRAPDLERRPLPPKGQVKRYFITSAQNNTGLFDNGWNSFTRLADYYSGEIFVGATTYSVTARTAAGQKTGRETAIEDTEWWDDAVLPYMVNNRVELAPGLVWCGELNILPTAVDPISGLESYTGAASAIYPHAKFAVKSIAAPKGQPAKMIYTTGACTLRNYIQKKQGQKAEFHHGYGGLIVEVCSDGTWFVRQLNSDSEGTIYDLDVCATPSGITVGNRVEAVVWGDIHVRELDREINKLQWGNGGILDMLRPAAQVVHDVLDFRSQNHHDRNDPWKSYSKHVNGLSCVQTEITEAAEWLAGASREWCETVVVRSNHDEALTRWLKEGDWKTDPENARFFLRANLAAVDAMHGCTVPFDVIAWAFRRCGFGMLNVSFLQRDEDFVVCPEAGGGIDLSHHGDKGPNGSRGSIQAYAKMGRKCIIAHSHSAGLMDGAMQVGASCSLEPDYGAGPSSWSRTHAIVYPNGKRTLFTVRSGRWRA